MRPTEYSEDVAQQAWAYLENYEAYDHAFPSIVGLCSVINRARSTVYLWAEDPEKEFSDILEAINEKQELVTFNKAIRNEYNATMAKLLLGKHGYHDKADNTHSGPNGGPIQTDHMIEFVGIDADSDSGED